MNSAWATNSISLTSLKDNCFVVINSFIHHLVMNFPFAFPGTPLTAKFSNSLPIIKGIIRKVQFSLCAEMVSLHLK